eukprot:gb/GECG01012349.1/.p1 GENE.gb/GECG01012349.1/~~gb/GECG01012349.1/.p1  ORF type:complete len:480 (+),score=55.79 gb/GECG01012349.1/:1-1440(+)
MVAIGTTLLAALQGVIRVLLIGLIGFLMQRFQKALNGQIRGALSKIVYLTLLPALIWFTLTEAIRKDKLDELVLLPVYSALYIAIGCGVGYLIAIIVERQGEIVKREHIMATVGFANNGYLPLVLAPAVLQANPFNRSGGENQSLSELLTEDADRAISVISIFFIVPNFAIWSVCFGLIQSAAKKGKKESDSKARVDDSQRGLQEVECDSSSAQEKDPFKDTGMEAETSAKETNASERQRNDPGKEEEGKTDVENRNGSRENLENEIEKEKEMHITASSLDNGTKLGDDNKMTVEELPLWKLTLKQLWSPPVIAVLLGLFCGLVTEVRKAFILEDSDELAPLEPTLTSAARSVGNSVMPTVLLILGANIADQVEHRDYSVRKSVLAAIAIGKLVILPAIGTGLVLLGLHLDLIRGDPILVFVLFLQACTPPAMNLVVLSELVDYAQTQISYILFVLYMVSIITMTVWVALYLYLAQESV